ncbi:stage 0 sporulation protein [bacterium 3DAC]|nr:stage 0 sporulation protein [bacterium 3DAC]
MHTYHSAKALDSNRKVIIEIPQDMSLDRGEKVIIDSEIGEIIAEYLGEFTTHVDLEEKEKFPVIRKATEEDILLWEEKKEFLEKVMRVARQKVKEYSVPMSLFAGEIALKGRNLTLYFTSSGRVDFRALVRDLQETFNVKIRLWQVGVRDRAQMLGGIGVCGRPLCCHKHILAFDNVSIYMAKRQLSVFNPSRISGQCGRLMCCLRYEDNVYLEMDEKGFPKVGDVVKLKEGKSGKVMTRNIFTNMVYIHTDEGGQAWIDLEDVSEVWRKGQLVFSYNGNSQDSKKQSSTSSDNESAGVEHSEHNNKSNDEIESEG